MTYCDLYSQTESSVCLVWLFPPLFLFLSVPALEAPFILAQHLLPVLFLEGPCSLFL
jgi:hypothetical protein